jgi:hypothetical protein
MCVNNIDKTVTHVPLLNTMGPTYVETPQRTTSNANLKRRQIVLTLKFN